MNSIFPQAFINGNLRLVSVMAVVALSLLNFACEEEGSCEIRIDINGNSCIYSCREGSTEDSCESSEGVDRVFHEGQSCANLGYPYKNDTGAFTAEPDDFNSPGDNGYFANLPSSPVGGCSGPYNGPTFDIQIDSQCQTAYAYSCSGFQKGVDAACAIYKTYQKDNPKIPDCPYCK
ncbi:MAG TPA: hypothetical protein P5280_13880 [Cyclobacteriaceae bacterium]|nr:hypothetical protein [Cyclobacteriaceae bacterium]